MKINPIIPGKRIIAIFGFCEILSFEEITESLQTEVMMFVNSVAEITHHVVYKNLGFPNKNLGEGFLLV